MGTTGTGNKNVNGVQVNDSLLSKSDLNTAEAWNNISNFGFSDYIISSDGGLKGKGANGIYRPIVSGQTNWGGSPIIFDFSKTSDRGKRVIDSGKIAVEGDDMNNAQAAALRRYGYSQVGKSAPNGYMPYYLWEKK